MQIRIIVAGKPALNYAKLALDDYLKRLIRHGSYELVIVKAGDKEAVSERLLQASSGCYRIALDERGKTPTTRELANTFESMKMAGEIKTVAFLIGAADGHTPELRSQCQLTLSLKYDPATRNRIDRPARTTLPHRNHPCGQPLP
jgi:23S rRNA (pseudouridine1915-N3)-methyltransferase